MKDARSIKIGFDARDGHRAALLARDEYVEIDELHAVAKVHALTAFDFLRV